jgi:hypothetical protein
MIYLLVIIFLLLSGLTILDFIKTNYKNLIFILIGVLLFFVAGFRPADVDRDYQNYVDFFYQNPTIKDSVLEPSFIIISSFVHTFLFGQALYLFIIYALIGVTLKMIAIKQLSNFQFTSLLIYFSYLFILQDMTQIRAGVATGLLLLCIKPLYERDLKKFLFFSALAICFHYSAIIILLLWFIKPLQINKWLFGAGILFSYLLYFSSAVYITNIVNLLPEGAIYAKVLAYEYDNNGLLNVFNFWQISRCLLSFIFLWKIDLLIKNNKYSIILVKIYILTTCLYVILAVSPVFAGRISDLFSVVDIIIIAGLISTFKPRFAGLFVVIAISFLYLSLNLFYNKIII